MAYEKFDRSRLRLLPLSQRIHDMSIDEMIPLAGPQVAQPNEDINLVASRIEQAILGQRAVIAAMGAHVIKTGLSRFVIDLVARGKLSHIALNGAGAIHDFELSLVGATTESVARYIQAGQFGLWKETGRINKVAALAANENMGLGEALGREILNGEYPYKETSILAQAYKHQVPVTVHVSIGQDIIHEHPNCSGAAFGQTSYDDFLVFAHAVENLERGVFLNVGTAVMGPEVYLKALAMARNVAHQRGEVIRNFTTAVFDIQDLANRDYHVEPTKSDPAYYLRYYKTVLVRTVLDGGESVYVQGDHRQTIPALWQRLVERG